MVNGNFKELARRKVPSKIHSASFCLLVTDNHHCTAFKLTNSNNTCHCGILTVFVTLFAMLDYMYVDMLCKRRGISGNLRHLFPRCFLQCFDVVPIITAIFGVMNNFNMPSTGLPTVALGIHGITQCSMTSRMPSTNILGGFAFTLIGNAVYTFGGRIITPSRTGTEAVYKYDLNTNN